jgi:hypothetical protein
MTVTLHCDDVLRWAAEYTGEPFMALIADPPYELNFMGNGKKDYWDNTGIAFRPETWHALAQHLHPGAFGACFASSRGWHRLACAIEDAGLIIHPSVFMLGWMQGSGWPKSTKIDDERFLGHRYGLQAMKPAVEPLIIWQKKYTHAPIENITRTGAGALWIDGCRVTGPEPHHNYGRTSGPESMAGASAVPFNTPTGGRWPPNVVLVHTPECRPGVTRPFQTSWSQPASHASQEPGWYGTLKYKDKLFGYCDSHGIEMVQPWICAPGGTFTVPAYVLGTSDAVSLADAPEHLLDQLEALLPIVARYSTHGNTLLQSEDASCDIADILVAGSSDAPAYAIARGLQVSEFLNYPDGCRSYPHWCDVHVRRLAMVCRESLPSLFDALVSVVQFLQTLRHIPRYQGTAPLSNWDDALLGGTAGSTGGNKIFATPCLRESLDETVSDNTDKPSQELLRAVRDDNTQASSTSVADSHEKCADNCEADIVAGVRLLWVLVCDLAQRFLPSLIIQRREIVINLQKCPVAALDEQAGERPGGPFRLASHRTATMFSPMVGWHAHTMDANNKNAPDNYGDTGPASRFFPQFGWADDIAEHLALADPMHYCPKASQAERSAGLSTRNQHPTVKPLALLRWIATLLLPPAAYAPRRLLVPFSGVSSEIVGGILAGWDDIVGIEQDKEYVEIGRQRIAYWTGQQTTTSMPTSAPPARPAPSSAAEQLSLFTGNQ